MPRSVRAPAAVAATLTLAIAAAACSPGGSPGLTSAPMSAASPTAGAFATVEPSPTSEPTAEPAPSGVLTLPTGFAAELEPGTYWSAPPFDLGFEFEIAEPGWVAGHLNPEFVDIQQFVGTPGEDLPTRIVGFAHPLQIYGSTNVEAAGLTPADVVDLWVERTDIDTANVANLQLLGGDAVRVDVHASAPMVPLFGGDDGIFRLDTAYDIRIVAIAIEDGPFLASVHAPAPELEDAWEQALPILESIDLLP